MKRKSRSETAVPEAANGHFDEFDLDEAKRFRMDVQGGPKVRGAYGASAGGNGGESDSDGEDVGPMPMVQPKAYAEDRRVRCTIRYTILMYCIYYKI